MGDPGLIDPSLLLQADVPAEDVVAAVFGGGKTGEPGDGKVLVLPVRSAHRIRTGATGTEAV